MKKLYILLFSGLAVTGSVQSQFNINATTAAKSISEPQTGISVHTNRAPGDVINTYSYDFSSAATNWVIDNAAATGGGWTIDTNGPTGFFSGGMGPIMSTSGNEFAMFDADGVTGTGYITMANPIDLSAEANVAFSFESYYRNFQGSAYFEISTDGTTWTSYEVHASLPLNENTDNPQLMTINISPVAANQATVWARFRYDSADDYAWMVDDVAFIEGYDDELILNESYMFAGTEGLDYYQIPNNQLQDFTFSAWAENGGINDQTNTELTVTVNDGATNIYTQSSTAQTVSALTSDSLEINSPFTAPGDGQYTVSYDLASDQVDQLISNNSRTLEPIVVGGDTYARDNNLISGSVGYLGTTPQVTKMGQYFEFFDDFLIGEVEIGVSSNSAAGEIIYAELRKLNNDGTAFDFVASSDDYTLQTADLGQNISLDITNGGYNAQAGDVIEVLAGHYGSEDVRVVTAQIAFGAVIYNGNDRSAQNSVLLVRPKRGFSNTTENTIDVANTLVYPNPANDGFNVRFNLNSASEVTINILDISGKNVMKKELNTLQKGEYDVSFGQDDLAKGVYTVNINSNGKVVNKKIIIK